MARLLLFRGFVGLHIKTISAPHFTPLVDSRRSCDRRVALDAGSYRTLLERMVTKRTVLERRWRAGSAAVSDKLLNLGGLGGWSAPENTKGGRDHETAAVPEPHAFYR